MATAPDTVTPLDDVSAFLGSEHGLFIDGDWRAGRGTDRINVFNPATGETIATVANANAQDVDDAVRSAHAAFEAGVWSALPPAERERRLLKFADLVEHNAEQLAQIETLNLYVVRSFETAGLRI